MSREEKAKALLLYWFGNFVLSFAVLERERGGEREGERERGRERERERRRERGRERGRERERERERDAVFNSEHGNQRARVMQPPNKPVLLQLLF